MSYLSWGLLLPLLCCSVPDPPRVLRELVATHAGSPVEALRKTKLPPESTLYPPLPLSSAAEAIIDDQTYVSRPISGIQKLMEGNPTGPSGWLGADIATSIADGVTTNQGSVDLWLFGDVSGWPSCDY